MAYLGNKPATSFTKATKDTFSGDGTTTAFTLSKIATTNDVEVFVENVQQEPTSAYGISGTTLTFTGAPPSGTNNIYVIHRSPAIQTVTHPFNQNLQAVDGSFTGVLKTDTIKKADGTGGLTVPTTVGNIVTTGGATFTGAVTGTDLTLSGGVYLGGTGSANYLDDYEEGDWTATFAGSASTATGKYVKTGALVHVQVFATLNVTSSVNAVISGLPFVVSTHSVGTAAHNNYTSNADQGYFTSGATSFTFISDNSVNAASTVTGNPKYIMVAGTYYTTA